MSDLSAADLVYVWLNRGRDNAEPIGRLAEKLNLPRRTVEEAIQQLRVRGIPVASGREGVWIGDYRDLAETYASLRTRMRSQAVTAAGIRRTMRQMRSHPYQQIPLFDAA